MFDWDDQELVNILWTEADESDDHIVPFARGSEEIFVDVSENFIKKERNEEIGNGRASNQKKTVSSNNKPAKLDSGCQIFQDPNNDKETDLVGYDWDSIGSFEDLDRIFSNADPEFGCPSLGNAVELWSSSMEYSNLASGAPSTSEQCGKTEDILDQVQPFTFGYSNMDDLTWCQCVPKNMHAIINHPRHAEPKNNLFVENKIASDMISKTLQVDSNLDTGSVSVPTEYSDKVDRQTYVLRRHKRSGEESKARPYQDLPKTRSSSENHFFHLEDHYAKTGQSPAFLEINWQTKLQEPASCPYNSNTTPLLSPSGHPHMHIQDSVTPILPQFHSAFKVPSGKSETLNEFPGSTANPSTMTPQEKIKKLRRRQQLRAMLAIQKQQKQFGNETSESQQSICQKHTIPDQMQLGGGNLKVNISTPDMNLPVEQDYSGIMSLASDDCFPEEAILNRLQGIVAKLDVQLRLCIRDSLCRLAQSATRRQFAKDTGNRMKPSGNYLKILPEEDTFADNRFARTPEAETDTNPIDRTVAHLLFHRPIEFPENLETAKSLSAAKILQERTSTNLLTMPRRNSVETSSAVNMSEYASNCEEVQNNVTEVQPLTNSQR